MSRQYLAATPFCKAGGSISLPRGPTGGDWGSKGP